MPTPSNTRPIYLYPRNRARLLEIQRLMSEAQDGRRVTLDQVVERLLDIAAEREDQGA